MNWFHTVTHTFMIIDAANDINLGIHKNCRIIPVAE